MSTITSHKLSMTCIRIHLKKCYVLLILLMMYSSLPMLGEEQYKWMKTLDKVTLNTANRRPCSGAIVDRKGYSTAATHPSSYQALRCPAVCRCHAER